MIFKRDTTRTAIAAVLLVPVILGLPLALMNGYFAYAVLVNQKNELASGGAALRELTLGQSIKMAASHLVIILVYLTVVGIWSRLNFGSDRSNSTASSSDQTSV